MTSVVEHRRYGVYCWPTCITVSHCQQMLTPLVLLLLGVVLGVFSLPMGDHNNASTLPRFPDCVERSLCYHSTDCCRGCCEENQCVSGNTTTTGGGECGDHDVPRDCSSLSCTNALQECAQETRFCLIAPCPQPLPKCVDKKPLNENPTIPLPVEY